jgi:sulfate adenylyltransferase
MRAALRPESARDAEERGANIVRKHLSSELGFSKKDRDINIRRIGFVASEITKNGGIALCRSPPTTRSARRCGR